jgi:hypothetical protein
LRDSNTAGVADNTFFFGPAEAVILIGDWDNDGIDTFGVYNPNVSSFSLKNTNATISDSVDHNFIYGVSKAGWTPIVGHWGTLRSPSTVETTTTDNEDATASSAIVDTALDQLLEEELLG